MNLQKELKQAGIKLLYKIFLTVNTFLNFWYNAS